MGKGILGVVIQIAKEWKLPKDQSNNHLPVPNVQRQGKCPGED